jgi:hypothetical protein
MGGLGFSARSHRRSGGCWWAPGWPPPGAPHPSPAAAGCGSGKRGSIRVNREGLTANPGDWGRGLLFLHPWLRRRHERRHLFLLLLSSAAAGGWGCARGRCRVAGCWDASRAAIFGSVHLSRTRVVFWLLGIKITLLNFEMTKIAQRYKTRKILLPRAIFMQEHIMSTWFFFCIVLYTLNFMYK